MTWSSDNRSATARRSTQAAALLGLAFAPSVSRAEDGGDVEVRVLAPHREVGETTVRREDTRDMPGTFGDPTRFAETLPGVVPTVSALQAFFVRGAPPTATGYFIDGVPVPALYHVGFGPSVIHPALVDRVDFYQGAPPARFGRYVGGIIDTTTTQPVETGPHGEGNLRVFDAGALAETPFADGKGTALVAARYGYPGVLLPLFASGTSLSYWDYQSRVTWNASGKDRISVFAFGSDDRLSQEQDLPPGAGGGSFMQQVVADQFHRVDLRWDHALGHDATMRVAATVGHDQVGNDVANATDDIARLRLELDARPLPTVRFHAGADAQIDWLSPASPPPGGSVTDNALVPTRRAVIAGAYADTAWRIAPRVEVVAGLRGDAYATAYDGSQGASSVTPVLDPRLSVRVRIATGVTGVSTFGTSHQLPGIPAQYPDVGGQFIQTGIQQGLQASVQTSQGLELALPGAFSLHSTVFLHDYFGLPDVSAPCTQVSPAECVTPNVNARAYGLEVLLRRSFAERFTAWVSYTLSRSTRQARGPGDDEPTMTILSEYDRTHVVSAVASYDFGGGWHAGGRVFAYTGRPYSATSEGVALVPYNTERLPGFYRIDARIEKSWMLGQRDRISVVLEGVNVTLNKEPVSVLCVAGPGGSGASGAPSARNLDTCTAQTVGPLTIPSIGVEGTFR